MNETLKEQCTEWIDKNRELGINILRTLTEVDSTTGNEGEVQKRARGLLPRCGFDDARYLFADEEKMRAHPLFIDSGSGADGRPNVIGLKNGSDPKNGKSIMLLCHMDSVPPGDEKKWTKNVRGEIDGDRYYARGAWDMKAGSVSAMLAVKALTDCGITLRGDVKYCGSIEEEKGGGLGALSVFEEGERADAVLVCEPVPMITVACAGVCYFKIEFEGVAAHGGRAHKGVNVIEKMTKVYTRLMELDEKRWHEKRFPLFESITGRSCNINVSVFHADGGTNVPDYGYLFGRASNVPGETMDELRSAIAACTVFEDDPWLQAHPPKIEWVGWQSEPWYQNENHPYVKMVKENADRVFKTDVQIAGKACGLDARFCEQFGIPAVSIGADGGNMHGIDEFVSISSMLDCAKLYAGIILDWCL